MPATNSVAAPACSPAAPLSYLVKRVEGEPAAGQMAVNGTHSEGQRGAMRPPPRLQAPDLAPEFGKRLPLPSMRHAQLHAPSLRFVLILFSTATEVNPPQIAGARRTPAGLRGLAVLLLTPSQPERRGAAPRSRRHLPSGLRPPREGIPRHLNRKEKARRAGQSEGSDGNSPSFGGSDRFKRAAVNPSLTRPAQSAAVPSGHGHSPCRSPKGHLGSLTRPLLPLADAAFSRRRCRRASSSGP